METFEEDSSASSSSSSSELQASPVACHGKSTGSPERVQVVAPSTIVTHKRKAGRKKFRETRHPIFRGVRERKGGKWVCEVREPNKKSRIWLGTFPSPDMAARAYDVAAIALRGKSAPLNFPDSAWLLPRAKSSSPRDIQLAAIQAAESFRPHHHSTTTAAATCSSSSSTSSIPVAKLPCVNDGKEDPSAETSTRPEAEAEANGERDRTKSVFVDEEALFNMPALLDSMAEGMLLTPPHQRFSWDEDDCHVDFSLWSDCN